MRKIKFWLIALISFLTTLFSTELLQRIVAGTMCGIFSLQSGLCQVYLIGTSHASATLPSASVNNPSSLISEYPAKNKFNYLPKAPINIIAQTNKTNGNQASLTTAGGCEIIMKSPANNQENSINEIEWVAKNEACGNSITTRLKPDSQQVEMTESNGNFTVLNLLFLNQMNLYLAYKSLISRIKIWLPLTYCLMRILVINAKNLNLLVTP